MEKNLETYHDMIQKYLDGSLTEELVLKFESDMASNPDLREEMEFFKTTRQVLEIEYKDNLSELVNKTSNSYQLKRNLTKVVIVAVIGGLAWMLYPMLDFQQKDSNDDKSEIIYVSEKIKNKHKEISEKVIDSVVITEKRTTNNPDPIEDIVASTEIEAIPKCVTPPTVKIETTHIYPNEYETGSLIFKTDEVLQFNVNGSNYGELTQLDELDKGIYKVIVRDKQDCVYDLGVFEIRQLPCAKKTDYVVSMSNNNKLIIPLMNLESKIGIVNAGGRVILEENVFEENFTWEGYDDLGNNVPDGYYKILVTTQDFSCSYNVIISN